MAAADEDQVARFMLSHLGEEAATVAAAIEAEAALQENADKHERWERIVARILAICAVEGPFRAPSLTAPPKRRRRHQAGTAVQAAAAAPAAMPEPATVPTRVPWLRLVVS